MKKREILLGILFVFIIYKNWRILRVEIKKRVDLSELTDKHYTLMLLLNQWLKVRQKGRNVAEYLYKDDIRNVAIYGMSYLGERLYDELIESDIKIKYLIDKKSQKEYRGVKTKYLNDNLPEVDAVIVTPVFYFDEIKKDLSTKVKGKILSLQDIIYEI